MLRQDGGGVLALTGDGILLSITADGRVSELCRRHGAGILVYNPLYNEVQIHTSGNTDATVLRLDSPGRGYTRRSTYTVLRTARVGDRHWFADTDGSLRDSGAERAVYGQTIVHSQASPGPKGMLAACGWNFSGEGIAGSAAVSGAGSMAGGARLMRRISVDGTVLSPQILTLPFRHVPTLVWEIEMNVEPDFLIQNYAYRGRTEQH